MLFLKQVIVVITHSAGTIRIDVLMLLKLYSPYNAALYQSVTETLPVHILHY